MDAGAAAAATADDDDGGGADDLVTFSGTPRLGNNELVGVLVDGADVSVEVVGLLVVNMLEAVMGFEPPVKEASEPASDGKPILGFAAGPPSAGAPEVCPTEVGAENGFGLLFPVSCDLF